MFIHLLSTFLCVPFHRSTSQARTAEYKSKFRACLLLIMLLCPIASYGAGLGRLAIDSALGQPFKAEIDLVAVKKEERPSADACQKEFANYLMLQGTETFHVVNDKEKQEQRFLKMRVDELNRVNQRLKPRNVKETMLKAGNYVCICYKCHGRSDS